MKEKHILFLVGNNVKDLSVYNIIRLFGPKCSMNVTKHFNCETYNIVYVICCTKFAKRYISKTGCTLDTHFKGH